MVRVSNALIGTLNVISAVVSLAVVGISLYLHFHGDSACRKFIEGPLLVTGLVLFVVSLLGLFGSFCRINALLYLYLIFLFLCILGLIGFTVFSFIVTNEGAGKAVSGQGFKEYRLGDYSHWVQKHIVDGNKWREIKSCLMDAQVCRSMAIDSPQSAAEFYKRKLSPIQSGCCKPPSYCGLEYKNATYWTMPKSGPAVPDSDCTTWSNNQEQLCFDCKSCKGGFLGNVRRQWREVLIFNVSLIVFVIIVYSTGCCASRNNHRDLRKYARYGQNPYPHP